MSSFHDGVCDDWDDIEAEAADEAEYCRGNSIVGLDVILTEPKRTADDAGRGIRIKHSRTELLIRTSTLKFGCDEFRPESGDEITLTKSRRKFVVTHDPTTNTVWNPSDGSGVFLRISVDEVT